MSELDANSLPDAPGFHLLDHFLADLSVENPYGHLQVEAVESLRLEQGVVVAVKPMEQADTYCVDVFVRLTALLGEQGVFVAELNYRATVRLHLVATDAADEVLRVQVPSALQPLIAAILEQNGRFSGYPEMHVGSFDFASVFAADKPLPVGDPDLPAG